MIPPGTPYSQQLRVVQIFSLTYLHQAVYGVPDVLSGGDEDAADDEDHHGGFVVQTEDIVVDTNRVKLQKMDDWLEYVQHFDLLVSLVSRQWKENISSVFLSFSGLEFLCGVSVMAWQPCCVVRDEEEGGGGGGWNQFESYRATGWPGLGCPQRN